MGTLVRRPFRQSLSFVVRPLTLTLREGLSLWNVSLSVDQDIDDAFAARCERKFVDHSTSLVLLLLVFTLVWWALDPLVMSDVALGLKVNAAWRTVVVVLCASYLGSTRVERLRRHLKTLFSLGVVLGCLAVGSALNRLGNPGQPYIYLLAIISFGGITLPLPLQARVTLSLAALLSVAVGYWGPTVAYRGHPLVALWWSTMGASLALSVWLGHMLHLLARENYLQTNQLADYGNELEVRVGERTQELQQLLAQVERAREDERTRIARELHDELGQEIAALGYSLKFTRERHARDPQSIGANLGELDGLLQRITKLTRDIVSELRPSVLDDLGLAPAAEWLVRRTQERYEIECSLSTQGDVKALPSELATAGFRILQEALTNVAKHAQATKVTVVIGMLGNALDLAICDNGIGLAAARAKGNTRGVGLLGMRERASAVGGSCIVREQGSGGTEVRCVLPIKSTTNSPASSLATGS